MSIKRAMYEIETSQGMAGLYHVTRLSSGSPVLFIHGFGSNADIWFAYPDSLGNFLKKQGMDCWSLRLSNATTGNIASLANEDLYVAISFIHEKTNQEILVVTHSMGGIIVRVLTSPQFEHPFPLATLESKIRGVVLLTVPNHGAEIGDIRKLEESAHQLRNYLKWERSSSPDFDLGFIQLTSKSTLIQNLNTPPMLNPNITWLNAVGKHDHIVPSKSASFLPTEVTIPSFEQRGFDSDHMVYPFANTLQKIADKIGEIATIFGSSF
ncbi:MAG: alpha/beta fold hydrolase, partial [Candidatus Heimdallarchaeota archaeon]|nr:alpha/beta fold hydrolase [Candidatus Heimdallarchaeota archaeon]